MTPSKDADIDDALEDTGAETDRESDGSGDAGVFEDAKGGEARVEEDAAKTSEWRIPSHFLLLGAMALRIFPVTLPAPSPMWTSAVIAGTVWSNELDEISGIAIDASAPEHIWAHNDSGDRPRLFILDLSGNLEAEVRLDGMTPYDPEDLTVGPCAPGDASRCLFFADIGDNRHARTFVTIARIRLPATLTPYPKAVQVDHLMHLSYPEGPHDAESLASHPRSGKLHIVQKTKNGKSEVFEIPEAAYKKHDAPIMLEKIAEVRFRHASVSGRLATAADYSPDGKCFSVRTYVQIHTWCHDDANTPLQTLLARERDTVRPPATFQSEALTYAPDNKTLYTTSERWPAPIITLHRQTE